MTHERDSSVVRATRFVWLIALAACGADEAVQAPVEVPPSVLPEPTTSASVASASSAPNVPASAAMDAGPRVPNAEASIARLRPGLRSCYNKGLANDPSIAGKIVVRVKIAGDGTIVDVSKIAGTGLPTEVEECMLRRMRGATFDAPGGFGSTIEVPISFIRQTMPLDASAD